MGRRNSEGMTETTISASATAAQSPVTEMARGDRKPGQELRVFSRVENLLCEFRAVRPENDLVTAAAMEREREGGSPCAGTKNDDAAHAGFLAPNRFSVPASRRRISGGV